jgi:hypothetical protein
MLICLLNSFWVDFRFGYKPCKLFDSIVQVRCFNRTLNSLLWMNTSPEFV